MVGHVPEADGLDEVAHIAAGIRANLESVISGKSDAIALLLTVLLAQGHLLVEDVPGVGKTTLAKALALSLDCTASRIQFTPDLMPGDVTGVSLYNGEERQFEFRPGAVFAHVVLADEINRASPKTQSALLECMAERQVTVDGSTYQLEAPFMVIATQNPIEMEGTYPLPEAQRDRFMARISLGYPDAASEMRMLENHGSESALKAVEPVADAATVARLSRSIQRVHVAPAIRQYAVDLAHATRRHPHLRLGASPRATLHLVQAASAAAALEGRRHVLPDDLQFVAVAVLSHRVLLSSEAASSRRLPEEVVAEIVGRTAVPSGARN